MPLTRITEDNIKPGTITANSIAEGISLGGSNSFTNAAFDQANTANILAQAAYDQANTGGGGDGGGVSAARSMTMTLLLN
jgi:hypothetical protein